MTEQGALWLAGCALIFTHAAIGVLVGMTIVAVVYARNLEFVHECLHALALPRPRLNAIFGELLAAPMLVSFPVWRREHMQHHRDVRIEGFRYRYDRLTTFGEYIVHSLMLRHFAQSLARIAQLDRRYRTISLAILAAVALCAVTRSPLPLLLWLAPLPLAAVIHTHIELPEHFGLDNGTDPLRSSRVIPAGRFVTWFVNANNYHAIHHWNPRLPIERLREAFASLPAGAAEVSTYREFYRWFFARLRRSQGDARAR